MKLPLLVDDTDVVDADGRLIAECGREIDATSLVSVLNALPEIIVELEVLEAVCTDRPKTTELLNRLKGLKK